MKSREEVLSAVEAWKAGRVTTGGPVQGLTPWEVLARLEGVPVAGPFENAVLNDLMARADAEVVPVLRGLAAEHKITFHAGAVF